MKIIVRYWLSTTQVEGTAKTYAGAMRLASKNQNTHAPTFYDENGVELRDDGNGLAYLEHRVGTGDESVRYAV